MSIGRNAGYNMVGFLVPTVLALATVPAYLAVIGVERYGVLAIAWLVLGYFGLFDLGLGRATAQRIAALRDAGPAERATALHTALRTNLLIGIAGGLILWPVAHLVFAQVMQMSPHLRAEALAAAPLLALSVPVATSLGVMSGAMMGRERFREANRIAIVNTVLFQLVPLGVAWLTGPDLSHVVAAGLCTRVLALALFHRALRGDMAGQRARGWDRAEMRRLLSFGGWVTLSALIGPLLVISDRFLIGALLGAVAVAHYAVPMDVTQRLGGVPASLGNALFPRLAVATGDEARRLTADAVAALYALMTPPVLAAIIAMDPLMRLWLGDAVGGQAAPLARILLVAAWFNAFAQMPFMRLQAQGRPDLVGKAHLCEVPVYLAVLVAATHAFGLAGAAAAFLLRVVVDGLVLFALAGRGLPHGRALLATLAVLIGAALAMECIVPASGVAATFGLAALAGLAALVPAWRIAPPVVRRLWPSRPVRGSGMPE